MTQKLPILIVGAGPTGLLLAIWLKTLDPAIPLRIIDHKSGPAATSRAMVVHARILEIYRQLGLVDGFLAQATIVRSVAIKHAGLTKGRLTFGNIGTGLSKYPFVTTFSQDQHERFLLAHLEKLGVVPEWERSLTNLRLGEDMIAAQINDTESDFAYVAGCDGGTSTCRKLSGIRMEGGTYDPRWFVTDVEVVGARKIEDLTICPGAHAFAVFLPIDGEQRVRIIGGRKALRDDLVFEDVVSMIREVTGLECRSADWFSTYKVHHKVADTFQKARLFLLGDAAHLHSPVGGQGMNAGLGDATNLAWKLAMVYRGRAPPELLQSFTQERRAFATLLVNTTDQVFRLTTDEGLLGYVIRNILMPMIMPLVWRLPQVSKLFFQRVSQIFIHYRASPLSVPSPGTVQAGDRLPWLQAGESDNFAFLENNCWQIHRYRKLRQDEATTLRGIPVYYFQPEQRLDTLGLSDTEGYLIRPDGHIALIFDFEECSVLEEYINEQKLLF